MKVKQLSTGEKVFRVISTLILLLIIFVIKNTKYIKIFVYYL